MQHVTAKTWIGLILEQRPDFFGCHETEQSRGGGGLLNRERFFRRVRDQGAVENERAKWLAPETRHSRRGSVLFPSSGFSVPLSPLPLRDGTEPESTVIGSVSWFGVSVKPVTGVLFGPSIEIANGRYPCARYGLTCLTTSSIGTRASSFDSNSCPFAKCGGRGGAFQFGEQRDEAGIPMQAGEVRIGFQ